MIIKSERIESDSLASPMDTFACPDAVPKPSESTEHNSEGSNEEPYTVPNVGDAPEQEDPKTQVMRKCILKQNRWRQLSQRLQKLPRRIKNPNCLCQLSLPMVIILPVHQERRQNRH